ncbi:choice-of-anchor P family protein [Plantactinospora sp. CA-290183]|uniref:choice-of-anchor P family protein n=1 Tax=Plantactinospora sp. CA-290183 TaxID=3240006 RepID=UPI003D8DCBBC
MRQVTGTARTPGRRGPGRRTLALIGLSALPLALLAVADPASAAPVGGRNVLYTTDADFDRGELAGVNHDRPGNNQLQLDSPQTPAGTWSVVQDGVHLGTQWGTVTWNTEAQGSVPAGTSITVEARAAHTLAELAEVWFRPMTGGVASGAYTLYGRYLEVRATLRAGPGGVSPVLADLRVEVANRTGIFSCQATALKAAGTVSTRANPPNTPCADDQVRRAQVRFDGGLVTARLSGLHARTEQTPDDLAGTPPMVGDDATATAGVRRSSISVGRHTIIEVGAVRATASVMCRADPAGPRSSHYGSSTIASLRINGVPVTVGPEPQTIPLAIGALRLNVGTSTATGFTQQAVVLDTARTDVVIGEATANIAGLPATPDGDPCEV